MFDVVSLTAVRATRRGGGCLHPRAVALNRQRTNCNKKLAVSKPTRYCFSQTFSSSISCRNERWYFRCSRVTATAPRLAMYPWGYRHHRYHRNSLGRRDGRGRRSELTSFSTGTRSRNSFSTIATFFITTSAVRVGVVLPHRLFRLASLDAAKSLDSRVRCICCPSEALNGIEGG